ncbi:carboxy-cis,cis-muconate cyclase, partial [Phenoliferia sp. Uapishka_3]
MTSYILVGTFNTPAVFTLAFDPSAGSLEVVAKSEATGAHSWLSLNVRSIYEENLPTWLTFFIHQSDKTRLYATAWTTPPGLAAYSINRQGSGAPTLKLINSVETLARSGYCCNSAVAVYSAGGPTGEVFKIDPTSGGFETEIQKLNFVDQEIQVDSGGVMDFGGLRHGAHSADLSPDQRTLYVADIGRNCIFVYAVAEDGTLTLTDKNIAPRADDGPRHVTPHPNGKIVYSLQEHTSMVDAFEVLEGQKLAWKQGVKIIPADMSPKSFWADEVRVSPGQEYLYASTRGLEPSEKGWVAVFPLLPSGQIAAEEPVALWETPTSGGWANAVEPSPLSTLKDGSGIDYITLTDSDEGLVLVLSWDGREIKEVARTKLDGGAGAATAVWL